MLTSRRQGCRWRWLLNSVHPEMMYCAVKQMDEENATSKNIDKFVPKKLAVCIGLKKELAFLTRTLNNGGREDEDEKTV